MPERAPFLVNPFCLSVSKIVLRIFTRLPVAVFLLPALLLRLLIRFAVLVRLLCSFIALFDVSFRLFARSPLILIGSEAFEA